MTKILFLDDRSKRIHSAIKKFKSEDLTIVTNVTECLRFLANEHWNIVYLDHDLGGSEFCDPDSSDCGMEIVRYLEKTGWPMDRPMPTFIIHSSNIFAATAMKVRLERIGYLVYEERWVYD